MADESRVVGRGRSSTKVQRVSWAVAAGALALLSACGSEPSSPEPSGGSGGGDTAPTEDFVESKKQLVGAEGGQIVLEGATLTFPPGALTTDVEVQVGALTETAQGQLPPMPAGVEKEAQVWAFEPHGLTFNEPVQVELDYPAEVQSPLRIAKLENPEDPDWAPADDDGQYLDGKATFTISGFSIYAVVTDPGGVLPPAMPPGGMPPLGDACLAEGTPFAPSAGDGTCTTAGPYVMNLQLINPGEVATHTAATGGNVSGVSCQPFQGGTDIVYEVRVVAGDTLTVSATTDAGVQLATAIQTTPECAAPGALDCSNVRTADGCVVSSADSGGVDFAGDTTYVTVLSDDPTALITTSFHRL